MYFLQIIHLSPITFNFSPQRSEAEKSARYRDLC